MQYYYNDLVLLSDATPGNAMVIIYPIPIALKPHTGTGTYPPPSPVSWNPVRGKGLAVDSWAL